MVCPSAVRTLHHPPVRSTPVEMNRARRTPSELDLSSRTFTSTPSSKIPIFSDHDSQDSRTTVRRTHLYTPIGVPGSLTSFTPTAPPALAGVCKESGNGLAWLASTDNTGRATSVWTLRNRSTCSSFCRSPSTLISHTSSSSRRSSSSDCEGAVRAGLLVRYTCEKSTGRKCTGHTLGVPW
jgi:hypothetical protein